MGRELCSADIAKTTVSYGDIWITYLATYSRILHVQKAYIDTHTHMDVCTMAYVIYG